MSALAIFLPRRFSRLVASDALNVSRDPMLLLAIVLSCAPIVLFWIGAQAMDEAAAGALGIAHLSRYVAPVALLLPAPLIGWVTGFLMLEDRDEGILTAIDVTPIGKLGFLLYRVSISAIAASAITIFALPVISPGLDVARSVLIVLLVASSAVISAAVLPAIARNKVEGLALTKLTNLLAIVPLLAAVPSPLRYLGGVLPSCWVGEVLGLSDVSALPLPALAVVSGLVQLVWGTALLRLFLRRVG